MLNVGADGGVLVIDSSLCSLITLLAVANAAAVEDAGVIA
jgi:hypothetical protein